MNQGQRKEERNQRKQKVKETRTLTFKGLKINIKTTQKNNHTEQIRVKKGGEKELWVKNGKQALTVINTFKPRRQRSEVTMLTPPRTQCGDGVTETMDQTRRKG